MKTLKLFFIAIFFVYQPLLHSQDSIDEILTPSQIDKYINESKQNMENESYDAAIEKLTQVIENDNQNYRALNLRGQCLVAKQVQKYEDPDDGDYTEALEDYTDALFAIRSYVNDAREREKKQEYREEKAEIFLNRGLAKMKYDKKKYFNLAIEDFDEANKLDRENYDVYINRSKAYYLTKEYGKELIDLRRLAKEMENPKSPLREKLDIAELYYKLGRAYINDSNDKTSACKYYKKALNLGYMEAERGVKRHCKF